MTVNTSNKRIEYSGSGSTTVFAYNFRILDETHLEVILVSSSGVETVQTLTTHYTVAGAGDAGGGDVTMATAPASGEALVLRRKMPFTQDIDYVSGDPFPAETHERGIDERVMEAQELIEITDRALKAPKQDSAIGDMPAAAARVGKLLTFGTTGDPEATAYTSAQVQAAINVASNAGTNDTEFIFHAEDSDTYTLARYLQNRHVVNVKDFGAAVDGVTEDSSAFSNAATAAGLTKTILLPEGTAVVSSGDFSQYSFVCFGDFYSDNATVNVTRLGSNANEVTVSVGSGGDFTTINEAIAHLIGRFPTATPQPKAVINLRTGFVMEEQVFAWGIDLSWIRITGDDAETTIDSSYLTESPSTGVDNYSSTYYPAFGVYAGGSGPKIDQMFDMGFTAQDPTFRNVGVLCYGPGSSIEVGRLSGIRRCGWYGVLANLGARVLAYESNFNTTYGRGFFANEGSLISARESTATGCLSTAYHSSDGSQINAEQADGSNSLVGFSTNNGGRINCKNATATGCQEGVYAGNGGEICAEGVTASGATGGNGVGIRAFQGGRIDASNADASGCASFGISIEHGSWCNARNVNAQKGGAPDPSDVRALTGSWINFDGGTGGTSEVVNTLTSNGVISS